MNHLIPIFKDCLQGRNLNKLGVGKEIKTKIKIRLRRSHPNTLWQNQAKGLNHTKLRRWRRAMKTWKWFKVNPAVGLKKKVVKVKNTIKIQTLAGLDSVVPPLKTALEDWTLRRNLRVLNLSIKFLRSLKGVNNSWWCVIHPTQTTL